MNFSISKLYAILFCIVPTILQASNQDIDRLTAYLHPALANKIRSEAIPLERQRVRPPYPPNSPTNSQKIRNLSDITAKKIVATALSNVVQYHASSSSNKSIIKSKSCSDLQSSHQTSYQSSKKWSLSKEIMQSSIEQIKEKQNKKIRELEKMSHYKLLGIKTCTTTTAAILIAAQKNSLKTRVAGFDDVLIVQLISSVLPAAISVGTILLATWKLESWIRSGDQAKIKAIKLQHSTEMHEVVKMIDKERADRITADEQEKTERIKINQDIRQECLKNITTSTTDLRNKVTALSSFLETTQDAIVHARTEISEIAPKVTLSLQNTHDLKSFIAMQIFPAINNIQTQVSAMREREEATINPLADNIEHAIARDADEEKSESPINHPRKMTRQRSLSVPNNLHVNSNDFQNQFKTKSKNEPHGLSGYAHAFISSAAHVLKGHDEETKKDSSNHVSQPQVHQKQLLSHTVTNPMPNNLKIHTANDGQSNSNSNSNNQTPHHSSRPSSKNKTKETPTSNSSTPQKKDKNTPSSKTKKETPTGLSGLMHSAASAISHLTHTPTAKD
jgi:hypothetical protein